MDVLEYPELGMEAIWKIEVENFPAFVIIDDKGNILKKRKDLKTSAEKNAYTIFHTLCWNIKKLLDKLPPTKTRLGSFATALWLLKE